MDSGVPNNRHHFSTTGMVAKPALRCREAHHL
jgi:hypothetical protein